MALITQTSRLFRRKPAVSPALANFLQGYSLEVMPKTAAKIEIFSDLLPIGTRVYVAHIEGTSLDEMIVTARRLKDDGFAVMPHVPARLIHNRRELTHLVSRYQQEAGVCEALLLAGGRNKPRGSYSHSMQLVETGLFDNFECLHFAGHPEGNRDIDPDGSNRAAMEALRWKQAFRDRSDAETALVTQFFFDAKPVIHWATQLRAAGIDIPIHVGFAGPAKLQTLLQYSLACGVGASLRVLQRRAKDIRKLMVPFTPTDLASEIATYNQQLPKSLFHGIHLFPLGGIEACAQWANDHAQVRRARSVT